MAKSPIVKIAVVAPVLGTLIIFNEEVVRLVQINTDAVGVPPDQALDFTIGKLRWLYLGLVCWGLGASLFAWWAPREVKRYSTVDDWLQAPPVAENAAYKMSKIIELARQVASHMTGEKRSLPPASLRRYFELVKQAGRNHNYDYHPQMERFYSGSADGLRSLAETIVKPAPYEGYTNEIFYNFLAGCDYDLQIIRYEALDATRALRRAVISVLFLGGIVTLAIPTLDTLSRVLQTIPLRANICQSGLETWTPIWVLQWCKAAA